DYGFIDATIKPSRPYDSSYHALVLNVIFRALSCISHHLSKIAPRTTSLHVRHLPAETAPQADADSRASRYLHGTSPRAPSLHARTVILLTWRQSGGWRASCPCFAWMGSAHRPERRSCQGSPGGPGYPKRDSLVC
ncbi:hypothetical protein GJAV_G00163390, partial [Gymnothorax javanicus]